MVYLLSFCASFFHTAVLFWMWVEPNPSRHQSNLLGKCEPRKIQPKIGDLSEMRSLPSSILRNLAKYLVQAFAVHRHSKDSLSLLTAIGYVVALTQRCGVVGYQGKVDGGCYWPYSNFKTCLSIANTWMRAVNPKVALLTFALTLKPLSLGASTREP
jgi:hypothetical protein